MSVSVKSIFSFKIHLQLIKLFYSKHRLKIQKQASSLQNPLFYNNNSETKKKKRLSLNVDDKAPPSNNSLGSGYNSSLAIIRAALTTFTPAQQ